MSGFIVSCIQMDIIAKNQEANLKKALNLIDQAADNKARLVCLPELFTTGFDYEYINECAVSQNNPITLALSKKAKENGIFIIAGSIPLKFQGKIYNSSFLFDNNGEILGYYNKINLFPLMDEDKHFSKGNRAGAFKTELGSLGIMICFDIRFPEVARHLRRNGAQIIIVPAQFPHPRIDHWITLLKARAIENQVYIIGVNRVGRDSSNVFFGHSRIIDPWGEEISLADDSEFVLNGEINLDKVYEVRKKLPCGF